MGAAAERPRQFLIRYRQKTGLSRTIFANLALPCSGPLHLHTPRFTVDSHTVTLAKAVGRVASFVIVIVLYCRYQIAAMRGRQRCDRQDRRIWWTHSSLRTAAMASQAHARGKRRDLKFLINSPKVIRSLLVFCRSVNSIYIRYTDYVLVNQYRNDIRYERMRSL